MNQRGTCRYCGRSLIYYPSPDGWMHYATGSRFCPEADLGERFVPRAQPIRKCGDDCPTHGLAALVTVPDFGDVKSYGIASERGT